MNLSRSSLRLVESINKETDLVLSEHRFINYRLLNPISETGLKRSGLTLTEGRRAAGGASAWRAGRAAGQRRFGSGGPGFFAGMAGERTGGTLSHAAGQWLGKKFGLTGATRAADAADRENAAAGDDELFRKQQHAIRMDPHAAFRAKAKAARDDEYDRQQHDVRTDPLAGGRARAKSSRTNDADIQTHNQGMEAGRTAHELGQEKQALERGALPGRHNRSIDAEIRADAAGKRGDEAGKSKHDYDQAELARKSELGELGHAGDKTAITHRDAAAVRADTAGKEAGEAGTTKHASTQAQAALDDSARKARHMEKRTGEIEAGEANTTRHGIFQAQGVRDLAAGDVRHRQTLDAASRADAAGKRGDEAGQSQHDFGQAELGRKSELSKLGHAGDKTAITHRDAAAVRNAELAVAKHPGELKDIGHAAELRSHAHGGNVDAIGYRDDAAKRAAELGAAGHGAALDAVDIAHANQSSKFVKDFDPDARDAGGLEREITKAKGQKELKGLAGDAPPPESGTAPGSKPRSIYAQAQSQTPSGGGGGGGGGAAPGGRGRSGVSVKPDKDGKCSTRPFTKFSNGACYKQDGEPGGDRGPAASSTENSDTGLFRSSRLRLLTF
jgi:hypothetical protein